MGIYPLRNMPEEINEILLTEQYKKLIDKKIKVSKETVLYCIVREWKKMKEGK